jgi:hypothetical protein
VHVFGVKHSQALDELMERRLFPVPTGFDKSINWVLNRRNFGKERRWRQRSLNFGQQKRLGKTFL